MAKRPRPGRCVYCLATFELLTWDHVFPLAWYPDTIPQNVEKWKVPACVPCNASHAANEGELFTKFGMCVDPNHEASSGIVEKALRGLNPADGRDLRDSEIRDALRQKVLREAMRGAEIPYEGIYPGFGVSEEIAATPADERMALRIRKGALDQLTEKIIRGVIYLKDNKFLGTSISYRALCID